MTKRTSHFTVFIIIINIKIVFALHQNMKNCLPVKMQQANLEKVAVLDVFRVDLEPPAHFVRHCRMTVKSRSPLYAHRHRKFLYHSDTVSRYSTSAVLI